MSQNVDQHEISKFEQMASRWWDKEGDFKPLHDINPLRLNFILDHANGLAGKKVLDIGCGGGILTESMAKEDAEVIGIDMGEMPLEVAKLHLLESKLSVDYQKSTAEEFAEKHAGQFDVVTCLEMLEHVPDPESIIKACHKLVKPDGHVFFSTINRNPKSFLFAIVGAEYILNMLPKGTHDFKKFIRPSELESWARPNGLSFKNMIGMHYNPITKKYWLGDNVDVNYIVHCLPE
ncbi:bifunctional 2-polyprenyl-6-hydroxyphenol methylase/3-demethylubiquinol 3-O-methyltransferase UbiG [Kangiella sp. HZ709]|uniref:bifunctional 2-polyprenyl-6-hydroxyphenol methylase/3-demethylubiquinol 3-O-methyltransferase UbiG n=1 Tax=Kangiella sp. HZ709 TaxID=2666328 RepID=UPI0012B00729|nr:bifunctional 2-polyprenyl-6-hydroxyphenol methylase/3-demethylubiquinol 3-O-methyltransferase UbiG [Kangiella sp. HZ709]MRX28353.1 bifunctional 2-polyprenyl-6-hydroxyphenol methylase/3-demethylubiquinol 3-O-methyltransferase UbiG [Kangiella sp. HZ709]